MPLSLCQLLESDVEFNVVFDFVVLWIGSTIFKVLASFSNLIMTKTSSSKYARELKVPIQKLFTEPLV